MCFRLLIGFCLFVSLCFRPSLSFFDEEGKGERERERERERESVCERERALCFEESEGGEKKKGSFNDKQQENAQKSRVNSGWYVPLQSVVQTFQTF